MAPLRSAVSRRLLRLPFPFSAPTVPGGVEAPPRRQRGRRLRHHLGRRYPPGWPGPPSSRRSPARPSPPGPARAPRPRPADPAGRGRRPGRLRRQPPQPRRHAAAGHVDPRAVAPQAVRGRGGRLLLPDAGHQRPVRPGARRHPDRAGQGGPAVGRPGRGPALRRLVDAHLPRGRAQPRWLGQPFRGGAAYLAVRCGVPVVPVHRRHQAHPPPGAQTAEACDRPGHLRPPAVPGPGRRQPPVRRSSSVPSPPWPTRPRAGGRPGGGRTPASHRRWSSRTHPRGAGRGRSATPTGGAPGSVAAGPSSSRGPGRPATAVPPGHWRGAAQTVKRPLLHGPPGRGPRWSRPRRPGCRGAPSTSRGRGHRGHRKRDPSASSTDIQ